MQMRMTAVFDSRRDAMEASGDCAVAPEEIFVIALDGEAVERGDLSDGARFGSAIGGAVGAILGIGAGMLAEGSAIAAAAPFTGLAGGGITGALVGGLTVVEERSAACHDGRVLWSAPVTEQNLAAVARSLRHHGARQVKLCQPHRS